MPRKARRMASTNGWSEYQKLVLSKLDEHGKALVTIQSDLTVLKVETGMLKVKSGLWGFAAGLLPALAALLLGPKFMTK